MPGTIRVLPQEVVALIAAGEVVQRPDACVKELVENSLDAGATVVTVALEGGGLDSIRVTDNGAGIQPEDLRLAFEPHATSKLGRAEELRGVRTLGFRGEALASIARVSRVTLTSRPRGSAFGMKAVNEGGQMVSIDQASGAEGTQVTVRDLFYNAPVRRDFMKKPQRETAQCAELVAQLILSRPDVAFRLTADGKQLYASPGDGSLEGALLSVYGVETVKALKKVDGGGQGLLVTGYVGVGEQSRASRAHQHFFLNGRAVRGPALSRAVEEACRHRVMIGRYPLCALSLTLPFEAVDVNVHPNKWEVRFAREPEIMQALGLAVGEALEGAPLDSPPPLFPPEPAPGFIPAVVTRAEPPPPLPKEPPAPRALKARDAALEAAPPPPPPPPVKAPEPEQLHAPQVPRAGEKAEVIGNAFNTYIIAQQGDRLLLVDQHALHERLLFDRMMARGQEDLPSQMLLAPELLELDYPSHQAFLANREDLAKAGFEAEEFGPRAVRLLSLPMELGQTAARRSFQDALDELRAQGGMSGHSRRERIVLAACKHAVKGGEALPEGTLQGLVDQMLREGVTPSCPHGRPIIVQVTRAELERRFRRIQG
ncbi:MAG: DNA mismatch repair endonuclease MutL [Clostridiales bacterium]|nr:DNA mismatch repair endonuclease MutL [Clostridiales bacterium]